MAAFFPNPRFLEELKSQPEVQEALRKAAGPAVRAANSRRHRIMPQTGRGRKNAIELVETAAGEILMVNTDRGGHLDEYGSKNNPAYSPLRGGARDAGFEVIE